MPFIKILTNVKIVDVVKLEINRDLGRCITKLPGKSETWLMVEVEDGRSLCFQGSTKPCLMAEVKLYGKAAKTSYEDLAHAITSLAEEKLSIPSDRVYVEFEETPYWGFEGNLF